MNELAFNLIVGGVFMYSLYSFMFKKDILSIGSSVKDYLQRRRKKYKVNQLSYIIERSDNINEIEQFLLCNAGYLSEDIISRMVNRIDYLKAVNIINEDDKYRVETIGNGTTMKERTGKSFQECCIEASEEMREEICLRK